MMTAREMRRPTQHQRPQDHRPS